LKRRRVSAANEVDVVQIPPTPLPISLSPPFDTVRRFLPRAPTSRVSRDSPVFY